ncbi:MAG: hypothetical protein HY465_01290 [Deltaproteobacteria bacterium]|nr:hypothetical protein [Deltaproteobacteria bacterium]
MKRKAYEFFLVGVVLVLTMVLAVGLYRGQTKVTKGQLLMHELSMLRSSIALSKTTKKANPKNLQDVSEIVVDPFGSPYHYDAERGWVSSTTEGYESW